MASEADLNALISTLQANFFGTQDQRRDAYERFEAAKHDPNFCLMLCQIFAGEHLDVTVRQLAGITLKNNMEAARARLDEKVFFEAGKVAMTCIDQLRDRVVAKTAASLVSRITSITGLAWWKSNFNVALDQFVVEGMLQSDNADRSYLGILCLQYLVEDASPQLGGAVGLIVTALSNYAIRKAQQRDLADRALATLCNIYEFGHKLDWTVERYSQSQEGLIASVQDGLNCAAGYFEQANILHAPNRTETRRLCLRILTLLIQFLLSPTDFNHKCCGRIANVACNVFTSGIGQHERDVAIEAVETIRAMLESSEVTMGEGGPAAGCDVIGDRIPAVLDATFQCMALRNDDVQARLENDSPTQKDVLRTVGMSKRNKQVDAMEGNADDAAYEEGDNPLHDGAQRMLRALSVAFAAPVFEATQQFAETRFMTPRDWKDQHVALDALTAIHDGCSDHMSSFVCVLGGELVKLCERHIGELAQGGGGGTTHVMVAAMALHALGTFFCDFIRLRAPLANSSLQLALTFMQHPTSKYVRFAAVTATKFIVNACIVTKSTDVLTTHHRNICETIAASLSAYSSNNFALLCDFIPNFSGLLTDNELGFFVELLSREADRRHDRLVNALGGRYFSSDGGMNQNVTVEKEYFDVVRACSGVWNLRFIPERDMRPAMQMLQQLVAFISNLLKAFTPIEDDAELLDYPLSLLRHFTSALAPFKQELCPILAHLPDSMIHVFKRCPDLHLRSYALANCHDMLLLEPSLFNEENLNGLLRCIDDVFAGDNPNQDTSMFQALQSDAALALYALAQMPRLPFPIDATMASVAQMVRGDLADDNPNMSTIAQCAGIFVGVAVNGNRHAVFKPGEVEQVICALRYAPKDHYGIEALAGVCNYVSRLAQAGEIDSARTLLPDLGNLLNSWARVIHEFEHSKQPVQRLLGCTNGELEQHMSAKARQAFRSAGN